METVSPFDNLTDAIAAVNLGGNIYMEPGSTTETFAGGSSISTAMTLLNNDGDTTVVTIGD